MRRVLLLLTIAFFNLHFFHAQMSLVQDINLGVNSSDPISFVEYQSNLYFIGKNSAGQNCIFRMDTNENVVQVKNYDISILRELFVLNGQLYAIVNIAQLGGSEITYSDGRIARINLFSADQLLNGFCANYITHIYDYRIFNNELYFSGRDGCNTNEFKQLYAFNGSNFRLVEAENPTGDFDPQDFEIHDNQLFFRGYKDSTGWELYKTNGTSVSLVLDYLTGPTDSFPAQLTSFNGYLYFGLLNGTANLQLFKLDTDTSSPIALLTAVQFDMKVYDNALYLAERDTNNDTNQLVKFDTNDTKTVIPFSNSAETATRILFFDEFDGVLYFAASKPSSGYELYRHFPGSSSQRIEDYNPGTQGSSPFFRSYYNNIVYFGADSGNGLGRELHKYVPEAIVTTSIPDPNFEQLLIDLGLDSGTINGEVLTANISGLTTLDISNRNIINLTGIEDFAALEQFTSIQNPLTTLDFSSNLNLLNISIINNPLSSINLTQNAALTNLTISNTTGATFSSLDITQNNNLSSLELGTNNISNLNISNNTQLTYLGLGNNPISTLDLSQNTALQSLSIYATNINSLDLSAHPNLQNLVGYSGQLTSLNLKSGSNFNLSFVDISNNPNLSCVDVDDPVSAQNNANWIKDVATIYSEDCASEALIQQTERNALIDFYNATNGANWTNNTNWLSNNPISTWHGITLDAFNRVSKIELFSNNLNGTLNSSLQDLSRLEDLNLLTNNLAGNIPSWIGSFSNLKNLFLSANNFSGPIPTEIGDLNNLESLFLNNNALIGSIPSSIGNLANLEVLFLQDNTLDGVIPSSLGNLNHIFSLRLDNNLLTGFIPTGISGPSLQFFSVSNNRLYGLLPNFTTAPLSELDISFNYFMFADIEAQFSFLNANVATFNYAPMNLYTEVQIETFTNGQNITLLPSFIDQAIINNATSGNNLYQWFKDNVLIVGATNSSYAIANASSGDIGTYQLRVTNSQIPNWTIFSNPISLEDTLSTDEVSMSNFQLYPNPTKDFIIIELPSAIEVSKITIYDAMGKQLSTHQVSTTNHKIDVSQLSNGVYFLKMEAVNSSSVKRFIKQ